MNNVDNYLYHKDEAFPHLPFEIKLSLDRVFAFWEEKAERGTESEKIHARSILAGVAHVPALRHPTDNLAFIKEHANEIRSLLSAVFPEILTNNEIKAASLPFFPVLFNMSKRLSGILSRTGPDFRLFLKGFDQDEIYMLACSFLIGVMYGIPINYKRPLYFDIPDVTTGITRHYRAMINGDFSSIKPKENFIPLTEEDIQLLIDNSHDIALWKSKIAPGTFVYEGLAIITLFDQTEDEALSELKQLLLTNDALREEASLEQLQHHLGQYLGVEGLEIGFEAYDEESSDIKALYGAARSSKLLGEMDESNVEDCFCEYSFDVLIKQRDSFSISNVHKQDWAPSQFIQRLSEAGVGSFIVAPLKYNEKVIGFIEITSAKEGVLNSMVANKLRDVLPMFTVAVSRTISQYQTQLEAIIQDKFTSIHPTVTWKFLKAAEHIFQQHHTGKMPEVQKIDFQEVNPLYGQFDIRGSSDARNASIQADLTDQLDMAGGVLRHASRHQALPIYQQLLFRIDQYRSALAQAIHAGDEVKIINFFKHELDPVFDHLSAIPSEMEMVRKYRESLNPELGVFYNQRKKYERSVTLINERISDYIDQQQLLAQKMFPHYFEKYKTDGVEYNAYIGQSLVQNEKFLALHLKNLRLWQLLITCGVENLHQSYMDELPMPLPITSLILAHSNPLAIRFRMDEKRFDVDGAYNIRYEILKKRIDKAYINGTTERLTQPGKLAIVYSQDREAEEYLQYISYLQSIDYLDDNLERLELQDLQGTTGLQAFRVGFKYEVAPDTLIKEMMQEVNF